MIVVKIELWRRSKGERAEAEAEEIGRMYIANVGGSAKRCDYNVAVCRRGSTDLRGRTRVGKVEGFPRLSYSVWRLVLRALKSAFPEER